jgi:hypothetical protein
MFFFFWQLLRACEGFKCSLSDRAVHVSPLKKTNLVFCCSMWKTGRDVKPHRVSSEEVERQATG